MLIKLKIHFLRSLNNFSMPFRFWPSLTFNSSMHSGYRKSVVCQYYLPFPSFGVILSGDVIISYVFIDKERHVFDSFNECLCRKY